MSCIILVYFKSGCECKMWQCSLNGKLANLSFVLFYFTLQYVAVRMHSCQCPRLRKFCSQSELKSTADDWFQNGVFFCCSSGSKSDIRIDRWFVYAIGSRTKFGFQLKCIVQFIASINYVLHLIHDSSWITALLCRVRQYETFNCMASNKSAPNQIFVLWMHEIDVIRWLVLYIFLAHSLLQRSSVQVHKCSMYSNQLIIPLGARHCIVNHSRPNR